MHPKDQTSDWPSTTPSTVGSKSSGARYGAELFRFASSWMSSEFLLERTSTRIGEQLPKSVTTGMYERKSSPLEDEDNKILCGFKSRWQKPAR